MRKTIETLTTAERRRLYEICWEFEERWTEGSPLSADDFIASDPDSEYGAVLPKDIVLEELREIQFELQTRQTASVATLPNGGQHYEFIEEVARGGSSAIWRVYDRHLGRECAIKFLLDSKDNQAMRLRLEKEARLIAKLTHPGIVPIYELASFADGRPFVCMKLVEGNTLQELLGRNPSIPFTYAIDIFTKVCQTMAYAHDRNVIHRDLKPSNIMVGEFGEVQVLDWGLGKESEEADECSPGEVRFSASWQGSQEERSTVQGSIFGTIAYMSPEQARGDVSSVDCRSDVFSLGAILCKVLTGTPPYSGNSPSEMLDNAQRASTTEAIRLINLCRHRPYARLAIQCLSPNPHARPANAREILNQIDLIGKGLFRYRVLKLAFLFGLTVIGTLVVASLVATKDTHQPVRVVLSPPLESASDPQTIIALANAGQFRLVLENYETTIEKHPMDAALHRSVFLALLNCHRYVESERIAKRLLEIADSKVEPWFMLGESLLGQARFLDSIDAFQKCRDIANQDEKDRFKIDAKLKQTESLIEMDKSWSGDTLEPSSLGNDVLRQYSTFCELKRKVQPAIAIQQALLDRGLETRFGLLAYHIPKLLHRPNLTKDELQQICSAIIQLLRAEFEFVCAIQPQQKLNKRAIGRELVEKLRSVEYLGYVRQLAMDERLNPLTRTELTQILSEIDLEFAK